jgi:hypothetical protein
MIDISDPLRESEAIASTSDIPGRGPNGKKLDATLSQRINY